MANQLMLAGLFAEGGRGGTIGFLIFIMMVVAWWKVFTKAGEAGWKSLIPFYNLYVLCRIAGKSFWWFLLMFVPVVNLFVAFVIAISIAHKFGKSFLFGLGLLFLPVLFYPILGFGSSTYRAYA
jgi:hypothetical protein